MHFWGFGVPGLCRGTGRLQRFHSTHTVMKSWRQLKRSSPNADMTASAYLVILTLTFPLSFKGTEKAHNFSQDKLFGAYPNTPNFGRPEKSLCASFPGKGHKKGTHINFFEGIVGSQKRGPKRALRWAETRVLKTDTRVSKRAF